MEMGQKASFAGSLSFSWRVLYGNSTQANLENILAMPDSLLSNTRAQEWPWIHHYQNNNTLAVQCRNTTVRLGRGVGSPIGEVEICINGVWRRVCHNNEWDYTEARVVCRQLGYSSVG